MFPCFCCIKFIVSLGYIFINLAAAVGDCFALELACFYNTTIYVGETMPHKMLLVEFVYTVLHSFSFELQRLLVSELNLSYIYEYVYGLFRCVSCI